METCALTQNEQQAPVSKVEFLLQLTRNSSD
jgi:hypothetical protein